MANQPQPATYHPNMQQSADERIADALEFIAIRMAGIENLLGTIRSDIHTIAHVQGTQASGQKSNP